MKRKKALAAPFVVTVSSAFALPLGCADKAATPPAETPTTAKPRDDGPPKRLVNPVHGKAPFPPVHVRKDGTCHPGYGPEENETIPCPAGLDHPDYAAKCADQLVMESPPGHCQCEFFANPPYVGVVPCPKHE